MRPTSDAALAFWFDEIEPAQWWATEPDFDAGVRARFGALLADAACGELFAWRATPRGRLAEIIVLDQFSRNIHRGSASAYANDAMALVLSQEAVDRGCLQALEASERAFLLMPYMHSESRLIHGRAEALFRAHTPAENYDFELKHKAIIDRFGRYPHRNEVLGRESTDEELDFLKQPGSSF